MGATSYMVLLRFSIELFIGESIFLIGRTRKENFIWRIFLSLLGYFALGTMYLFLLKQIPIEFPLIHACFYLGLCLLSIIGIYICYDMSQIEAIFVGTGGYATEHIAFAVARIIQYLTGLYADVLGAVLEYLIFRFLIYVLISAMLYGLVIRRNREKEEFKEKDIRMVEFAIIILVAAIGLSVFCTTPTYSSGAPVLAYIICPLYSMLCCILVILIEYYVFRENRLSRENETMEQLLQMANAQQKSSKEAIDIINMKCHDLKHQMKLLQKMQDDGERLEYIEEMKKAISIYDATYHTGCEALDYVLREKSLISEEYGIDFSCMVDGAAISFINNADIYALMGNALDNALECVIKEAEGQRIISFRIQRHAQMVFIHLENTCSKPPEFQNGIPITNKEDKNQHGFGVKSMCYIVRKYNGEIWMRAQNGKYLLDMMFAENGERVE